MKTKKYDITAIGECLIDFNSRDSKTKTLLYEGNAGGAPANVLACASKMGDHTAIFSKVGQDRFGDFLDETLSSIGIDTSGMIKSKEYPTTLAFVSLDRTGNRSFRFYRKGTADIHLTVNEVNMEKLTDTKIVHFGSVSMTMEPSRSTTFTAIQRAKAAGAKISFDPNLRQMMWDNLQDAKEQMLRGIAFSDYVKLSEEELIFLTDGSNLEQRMLSLLHNNKISFLIVTLGPQGCLCLYKENFYRSYAYNVPCVDTTGAGDAFWGMALHKILKHNSDKWKQDEILDLLRFANAAGSLTTIRKGAISAIPTMEEVVECVNHTSLCS